MTTTPAWPGTPVNSPRQVLFASLIGTTIEFFDFYIYATAAVLVFPKLFFSRSDPATAVLESLATFGIAFLRLVDDDAFELGFFIEEVGNVEKRVAIQSDIDKGRLHAGQHAHDATFVNVADDSLILFTAFDVELGYSFIFDDRDLFFATVHTNN